MAGLNRQAGYATDCELNSTGLVMKCDCDLQYKTKIQIEYFKKKHLKFSDLFC